MVHGFTLCFEITGFFTSSRESNRLSGVSHVNQVQGTTVGLEKCTVGTKTKQVWDRFKLFSSHKGSKWKRKWIGIINEWGGCKMKIDGCFNHLNNVENFVGLSIGT